MPEDDGRSVPSPVFLPIDDKILKESVRSCIKHSHNTGLTTLNDIPSDMNVCFLGTGSGIPSPQRNSSATLLRLGGTSFLFDAGEGVQRQFQFVVGQAKLPKVERIFITHLHADHIFGLPGLLLAMQDKIRMQVQALSKKKKQQQQQQRGKNKENDIFVLKIYGPPGLYHYIAASLQLSCTKLTYLKVEVYELMGARVKRVVSPLYQQKRIRDPFHDDYPEYSYAGEIERKRIYAQDGTWTIQAPPPLTRDMIIDKRNDERATDRLDRLHIRAAEVDHLPGIVTFGFVVEESEPSRNIDAERAKELGVSHYKNLELLKHGFSVSPDMDGFEGNEDVQPHQVLKPKFKRARKIAIVGDNRNWTRQMSEISQNADVLVHEATLVEEDYSVSSWLAGTCLLEIVRSGF
jgi:ribonuclease BN (tRNA processing enzyme)